MASNSQGNQGGKSSRGFASMDPQRQREIASEGGRAAHEKGTAHEFTSEEARRAGSMSHGGGGGGNQQSGGQGGQGGRGGNQASAGGGTRGGTPEQHAKAGSQSHKNDK